MNDDAILRVLSRKREEHPELAAPLTWVGLLRILKREGVLFASVPLARRGRLVGVEGTWLILADTRRRARHLWIAAHELAHLWLHVDESSVDRFELTFNMDDFDGDDPREGEAEYLAACMLYGPEYR